MKKLIVLALIFFNLVLDGSHRLHRAAESGEVYQDREGYVIFFHPQCADWRY